MVGAPSCREVAEGTARAAADAKQEAESVALKRFSQVSIVG
jgi:hypothetical protein